jgi:YegS/Rv2252/BmrU family lipid kinase
MTEPSGAPGPARRLLLIVHPTAGGGRGARQLPEVVQILRTAGLEVTSELTRSIEHAEELAGRAAAEDRVAVAVGGDGLAGRVAGACAANGGLFAALPGGRGNDFVRGLGISTNIVEAARKFAQWGERAVDIGYVTGPDGSPRAFLGIASLGFDSDVQVRANRTRLIRGSSVYTYAALRTLASWRPASFSVCGDDGPVETLVGWSVAAANSAYYGGGMHYAPSALIDDGFLELITAERSSKLQFLRLLPKVFTGRHVGDPRMQVRRARKIQVDADRPFQVYADGDPLADLPATISVTQGGLRLLGPVG